MKIQKIYISWPQTDSISVYKKCYIALNCDQKHQFVGVCAPSPWGQEYAIFLGSSFPQIIFISRCQKNHKNTKSLECYTYIDRCERQKWLLCFCHSNMFTHDLKWPHTLYNIGFLIQDSICCAVHWWAFITFC